MLSDSFAIRHGRGHADCALILNKLCVGLLLLSVFSLHGIASSVTIHEPTSSSPIHVEACECPAGEFTYRFSWNVTDHPSYVSANGVVVVFAVEDSTGSRSTTTRIYPGGGSYSNWTGTKHADAEVCDSYYVEVEIYARTPSNGTGTRLASSRENGAVIVEGCWTPILDYGPSALDFGDSEDSMEIIVRNAGSGTLEYSLSESCCWITNISPSPSSGSSTGEWNSYRVYVDRSCLSPGETDSYDIPISSNGGSGSVTAIIEREVDHWVSTPNVPSGPESGTVGQSLSFSTGGASCSQGHSVEYQFDWSDGSGYSSWSSSTNRSHSYGISGTYNVRARARCSSDNSIVSAWSSARQVTIGTHAISTPDTPSGPTSGTVAEPLAFTTGGASCSQGHSVEYQFDWGDGSGYSSWSSSTNRSHSYGISGTYNVRARARCSSDNSIISVWAASLVVHIHNDMVDLELKSMGTVPSVITPIGEHMNHGVIGQDMTIEISFAIHGAQLPADGKTELWAGFQLIDYWDGHNPISTWPVFSSGQPAVLEEMIGENVEVLHLSLSEERALNRGESVTRTFSYPVPDQWHDESVLFADTLKVSIGFEAPRYDEVDYANNVLENNIQISPSLDQQIDGLFLLLSTGLSAKGLPEAAAGSKMAGGFIKMMKALVDGRPEDAAIEFVKIWIFSASHAYEPDKADVTKIFLDTTNGVIRFAGMLSSSKNAALSVLFGANVILKASAAGLETAKSLWASFALEHIIWLVENGTLSLSYAIDAGLTLREAIELGLLTLREAAAEGYITADNVAECIGQGVCTIWDAISLSVVDIWWAIGNGLCTVGEAIAGGFLSGWEWATSAGGSILPLAQLSSTLSNVEILAVDQSGRRTGISYNSMLEEIPGGQVLADGESISLWIPEDAGEFSVFISASSHVDLDLQVTHSTDAPPVRSEYELEISPATAISATSTDLVRDGKLAIDTNGDGLIDGWLEPAAAYEIRKGDVNGDGRIDLADVRAVYQAALGLLDLTMEQSAAADINGDGFLGQDDAFALADYISGYGDI